MPVLLRRTHIPSLMIIGYTDHQMDIFNGYTMHLVTEKTQVIY